MSKRASELTRRFLSMVVVRLLLFRHGKETADYWAWEETCLPFGEPLWHQLWVGVRMVATRKVGEHE